MHFGKYLNAHLKFTEYGRKQASTYVNTLPHCSPASVGLAQARPNYVYGHKQANTHVRNAVPLVWGSLGLGPITVYGHKQANTHVRNAVPLVWGSLGLGPNMSCMPDDDVILLQKVLGSKHHEVV